MVLVVCFSNRLASRSDFNGDIHTRRQVELLELVNRLGGRLDDVNEPFVGALLESFLRFFVRMRRAQDGKAFHAGWERDRSGDTSPRAFDGIGNVAGGLVDDPMVKGLKSNSNALSSHRKNNCLLMVSFRFASRGKAQEI